MRKRKVKAVIFDVDGVLIDTREALYKFYRDLFLEFGLGRLKKAEIMKYHGLTGLEWMKALLPKGKRNDQKLIDKMRGWFSKHYVSDYVFKYGKIIPGVKETLRKLRVKKAVVTNNDKDTMKKIMKRFGFKFDIVVTEEDVLPKPSPAPLLLACKKLGIEKSRVIYIGDTRIDVKTGRAAGIETYLLSHGYNKNLRCKKIKKFEEVLRLVG